ncbi:MAG: hypothetical protein J5486_08530 [Bacteroidaceae bacterium]|nr:hypothetical protein [Bacteroidaceae bacterium]
MKTYIIPSILIVNLSSRHALLQNSIVADGTKTITTQDDGSWVKENNSSSNYNVWKDDWRE